jgi:GLPGLI family protein
MKNSFLLFILIITALSSFCQNKESTVTSIIYSIELKQKGALVLADSCLLYSLENKSFFYSLNKIRYRKVMEEKIQLAMANGGDLKLNLDDGKLLTNFLPYSMIKDFVNNKSIFIEDINEQHFGYIKDSTLKRNWELLDDTMKINNLECKKAFYKKNGTEIVAWYCPKIPIQDGPFTYSGLPGLIVTVENNYGWSASLVRISYNDSKKAVEKIPNYTLITEKEISKIK